MINKGTLRRINDRPRKARLLPLAGAGAVALEAALFALSPSPLIALAALPVGALGVFAAYRAEKERRITTLDYENLSGEEAARFWTMGAALEVLASSEALWRLDDAAGRVSVSSEVASAPERTPVGVGQLDTPGIRASLPIWGIDAGDESLMFFPEALLVYSDDRYEGVSYRSVKVELSFVRFFEKEEVPGDAQVVEHPRRAGNGGRAYGPNLRDPVVLYGLVEIKLPCTREVRLQVSSLEAAARFAGAFGAKETHRERGGAHRPPAVEKEATWAHEVLGVGGDASIGEITATYKKLARTYHPDKVLELPAEAREISERRMKEINVAYSELKRRGQKAARPG
jgi:DnaJ-like protein